MSGGCTKNIMALVTENRDCTEGSFFSKVEYEMEGKNRESLLLLHYSKKTTSPRELLVALARLDRLSCQDDLLL
jgi:hypothetical protein